MKSKKKKSIETIKNSNEITEKIIEDYSLKQEKKGNEEKWEKIETVIIKKYNNFKPGSKIISFDLDDTLITEKGKKFQYNENFPKDYKTMYDEKKMNETLEEYSKKNYIFIVFSNQSIISLGKINEDLFKERIDKKELNNNIKIDKENSYYIGDAAGREKTKNKKKDFSDSDYKFALNCNLNFLTPEEFFLNEKQTIPKIKEDYHIYDNNNNDHIKFNDKNKEMIILIGAPGSGKSTFCENYLKNYIRINQDNLKNKKKCFEKAIEAIKDNNNIVIDNTNPQKNIREEYIKIAKDNNYKVRAFIMKVNKDLAFHLNNLRIINNERKHFSEAVNQIPIHTFFKNYEEPKFNEGFDDIVQVNFVPGPFQSEKDKEIFYMFS